MAPVVFDCRGRKIAPYSVAPWHNEKPLRQILPLLQALRGDFFCMPFGANATPFRGEQHQVHGETANNKWTFVKFERTAASVELHLRMRTSVRPGRVDKLIRLVDGHNVVYCRNRIELNSGPMSFAYHAMIKFPEAPRSGLISTSPMIYGQVFPEPAELPENRGYSILKPGATFDQLSRVPTITGDFADISTYPDRRGYEDIAQILNDPKSTLAWSAVSFPKNQYVWFTLKDPRVLTGTVFWFSNGGRHYPPWNGRHTCVLGVEEATSYFYGLKESAQPNPFTKLGVRTAFDFEVGRPLDVGVISGIAITPRGFDRVRSIDPNAKGIRLTADSGKKVDVPVDLEFLRN